MCNIKIKFILLKFPLFLTRFTQAEKFSNHYMKRTFALQYLYQQYPFQNTLNQSKIPTFEREKKKKKTRRSKITTTEVSSLRCIISSKRKRKKNISIIKRELLWSVSLSLVHISKVLNHDHDVINY